MLAWAFDFIVMPWATATALTAFDTEMNGVSGRWSYAKQIMAMSGPRRATARPRC